MLLLLLPLLAEAREDAFAELPLYQAQTLISEVVGPMHWFDATYMEAESGGCRIGVPAVPIEQAKVEAVGLFCYFPAGHGPSIPPEDPALRPHYRLAQRAVRRSEPGIRRLRVAYVGTWTQVEVFDLVPIPAVGNPNVSRIYQYSRALYAITDAGIELADPPGLYSTGGTGLAPQVGEVSYLEVERPEGLGGTPILSVAQFEELELYSAGERAIRTAVAQALPGWQQGERHPPVKDPERVLPADLNRSFQFEVRGYARPKSDASGELASQANTGRTFAAPLELALRERLEWHWVDIELGLTLDAGMDLPHHQVWLQATGPTGEVQRVEWRVAVKTLEDQGVHFVLDVEQQVHSRSEPPRKADRPSQLVVEAAHPYGVIDLYPQGIGQSSRAFTEEQRDFVVVTTPEPSHSGHDASGRPEMTLQNPKLTNYVFLAEMVSDDYYPSAQVAQGQGLMEALCKALEAKLGASDAEVLELTNELALAFNELNEDFAENGSEIETMARESIAEDVGFILEVYGYGHIDIEDAIAEREW